uniref:Uncharacterized protein n=1 Tax=Ditylum brightwellii TaxID=49249 RepID=A0A6S8ZX02_9STRA|mmetsp:Transcript_6881/g.9104  ORF Transcript_6881/g.9104 Transcript_6881/m.9104 type:complete len:135 (-) Transcript_6881:147-551(-)
MVIKEKKYVIELSSRVQYIDVLSASSLFFVRDNYDLLTSEIGRVVCSNQNVIKLGKIDGSKRDFRATDDSGLDQDLRVFAICDMEPRERGVARKANNRSNYLFRLKVKIFLFSPRLTMHGEDDLNNQSRSTAQT